MRLVNGWCRFVELAGNVAIIAKSDRKKAGWELLLTTTQTTRDAQALRAPVQSHIPPSECPRHYAHVNKPTNRD